MKNRATLALIALFLFAVACSLPGYSKEATPKQKSSQLRLVVVLTRHGVRSPTDPSELAAYSAHAWPKWEVAPGDLTPHGAELMRQFGAYYRTYYSSLGLLPEHGCPASGSVFVWADVDRRTIATGRSLLDGFVPGCRNSVQHAQIGKDDPLFDPLPKLGRADSTLSEASVLGALGENPNAVLDAYRGAYAALDRVLGCSTACKQLSQVATTIEPDRDTGLAGVSGGLDAAGTAAENLLLAYADGQPNVGWGQADLATILHVMQLHALKARIEHETYYNARAEGSNLLAHITATLDQASGKPDVQTRVPAGTRFAAIVGHDTSLSKIAGMLHLSWLMKGYLFNDAPPGGALVFELYTQASAPPFIKLSFTAQSLDQMRAGNGSKPSRVGVYVPGCPSMECPLSTFDAIVQRSLDTRFVSRW